MSNPSEVKKDLEKIKSNNLNKNINKSNIILKN